MFKLDENKYVFIIVYLCIIDDFVLVMMRESFKGFNLNIM